MLKLKPSGNNIHYVSSFHAKVISTLYLDFIIDQAFITTYIHFSHIFSVHTSHNYLLAFSVPLTALSSSLSSEVQNVTTSVQ